MRLEKHYIGIILCLIVLLLSCGNKPHKKAEVTLNDEKNTEQLEADTTVASTQKEVEKREDQPSTPISRTSSSNYSSSSSDYDNMRGFDPASEEDMDDNGMSRYMENDDEEGWD